MTRTPDPTPSRTRRALRLVALTAGLSLGLAAPLEGCSVDCPGAEPASSYRIVSLYSKDVVPAGWVPGSGYLTLTQSAMFLNYETEDGSRWEVEYMRTDGP